MRRTRSKEIIAGRINANGGIAAGDDFISTKTGTGVYRLYFPNGFRLLSITATTGSAVVTMFASSYTENSVLISTSPAADTFFSFTAVGYRV